MRARASITRAFRWYEGHLHTSPLRTKSITSFVILSCADCLRQHLERQEAVTQEDPWDWARTARMAVFGGTAHPVWVASWFAFLEKWKPSPPPGVSKLTLLRVGATKMVIDQSSSSPVRVLVCFA